MQNLPAGSCPPLQPTGADRCCMGVMTADLATDLRGAFPDFVRAHQHGVFSAALAMTRHWHDAEEITQETFVRAFRALGGYEPQRIRELRAKPWLARIALNLVRNRARTAGRRLQTAPLELDVAQSGDDPADWLGDEEVWRDRLARLPADQAAAVVLRHVWSLGYAELAEALGVPEGTAKARVSRGLARLRDVMAAEPVEVT